MEQKMTELRRSEQDKATSLTDHQNKLTTLKNDLARAQNERIQAESQATQMRDAVKVKNDQLISTQKELEDQTNKLAVLREHNEHITVKFNAEHESLTQIQKTNVALECELKSLQGKYEQIIKEKHKTHESEFDKLMQVNIGLIYKFLLSCC